MTSMSSNVFLWASKNGGLSPPLPWAHMGHKSVMHWMFFMVCIMQTFLIFSYIKGLYICVCVCRLKNIQFQKKNRQACGVKKTNMTWIWKGPLACIVQVLCHTSNQTCNPLLQPKMYPPNRQEAKPVGFLSWWCAPWHVSRTKSTTERIAGLLIKLSARTWSPTTRLSIYTAPIGPNLHREVLKWGFRHIKPHRFSAKGNVEAFSESWGSERAVMSRNFSHWVRQTDFSVTGSWAEKQ